MRVSRVRFTVRWMMVVIFTAALLGAFEAGRRYERDRGRRGALKVQFVRHVGSWELKNSAYPGERGPTNDHKQE
jgi:hypothetical protein